jgi:hypothetical protein
MISWDVDELETLEFDETTLEVDWELDAIEELVDDEELGEEDVD